LLRESKLAQHPPNLGAEYRLTPIASEAIDRHGGIDRRVIDEAIERRRISRSTFVKTTGLLTALSVATTSTRLSAQTLKPVFPPPRPGKVHVLESNSQTVHVGVMDPAVPSVLTIESGDVVDYPKTWFMWGNEPQYGMSFEAREPIRRKYPQGPYSMAGPVAIKDAMPGDIVEWRMIKLRPAAWGWNSAPAGVGALPADFPTPYLKYFRFDDAREYADFGSGILIPLRPVQGVMALQPAGDAPVSAILAGPWGGNVNQRDLVAGTSLFLSVQVPEAKTWTGDSHAAQGDGVVDQTTIETAMDDLQIQYVLHKGVELTLPIAETPDYWITMGYSDKSLDEAIVNALRSAIAFISKAASLSEQDVYALYSIVGSFRVTQYAEQTGSAYTSISPKAVHGMLPKAVFAPDLVAKISNYLRPSG
jgi:acetamidase/formamidase